MSFARRRSPMPPRHKRPDRLRLGLRLAAGVAPARAAAAERVAEAEVDALLRDPDFAELVAECRRLRDLPEDQRLARLEAAAWDVLELAIVDGDMRAVLFVLDERRRGRNPARTLAGRVAAAARRAAQDPPPAVAPPADPPAPSPSPRRPRRDPSVRSVARGAAHLRRAVIAENALRDGNGDGAPAVLTPAPSRAPRRVVDRSGCSTAVRLLFPVVDGAGRPTPLALDGLAAYLAQGP